MGSCKALFLTALCCVQEQQTQHFPLPTTASRVTLIIFAASRCCKLTIHRTRAACQRPRCQEHSPASRTQPELHVMHVHPTIACTSVKLAALPGFHAAIRARQSSSWLTGRPMQCVQAALQCASVCVVELHEFNQAICKAETCCCETPPISCVVAVSSSMTRT